MVPELRQALLNHKAMAVYTQPGDYVFASSSGRAMNPDLLRRTLQDALRTLGISFDMPRADGLHLLRHTSGSLVYHHCGCEAHSGMARTHEQPGGEAVHQVEPLVH
jgi:hypothetical protein